ncbi:MAG TPA: TlyA family RNA methyltransferase [Caldisericia bacterium]|nr:TlyA family RNA methyltransferase [Caldisericia bacterium]HPF48939.1 TlyA family RNA methyltransferase [Caldisericia bacterium]HPI83197.1 TlyA family RNA methyltransferase [Caldisericia bacterium]HPQ92424.1 TlyA family RNA methyltransferase [Caldisericia bacterium]HRV74478.1 TlyA family RNA methyltransferase [Caldisericia bacterium]
MKTNAKKVRVDELLSTDRYGFSRTQAKTLIMAGSVFYKEQRVAKPSQLVPEDAELFVKDKPKYVSRGGFKLEHAIGAFGLRLAGLVAADVGASTGGFTDCMLQNGVIKVYAIDVGRGQLVKGLMDDPRVVLMDKTNARYLKREDFTEQLDFATVDCSFISGDKVIAPLLNIISESGFIVWLLKPQFESDRKYIGKGGVIKDEVILREAIEDALARVVAAGATIAGISPSKTKGTDGNQEFLVLLKLSGEGLSIPQACQQALQDLKVKQQSVNS